MEFKEYTKEELEKIEDYAEKLTPIGDMALLMGVDAAELRNEIRNTTTAASIAYRRGKARGLYVVREAAIRKASNGDLTAAGVVQRYQSLMEDDEVR